MTSNPVKKEAVTLLPCPFCGAAPVQQDGYLAQIGGRFPGWFCSNGHTIEMNVTDWNTRQADPRIAELEAALEEIAKHESSVPDSHMECGECHDAYLDDYVSVKRIARAALNRKDKP